MTTFKDDEDTKLLTSRRKLGFVRGKDVREGHGQEGGLGTT